MGQRMMHGCIGATRIDVHEKVVPFQGRFQKTSRTDRACVVDQDIEPPEDIDRRAYGLGDRHFIAHIDLQG
ncbi:hypothetical protein D3C87_1582060 [compost metagenome]